MNFKSNKYIFRVIAGLSLLAGSLASCTDDKIDLNPGQDNFGGDIDLNYEGYSVGFTVTLDAQGATRASSDIDDYVDTKDKFRVFFFDKNGQFLFGAVDRTVTPLGKDDEGRDKLFVRIPLNYITDRNENVYDVNTLRDYLKDHDFKIAVLANWPNEGRFSGHDREDESESGDIGEESSELKGEPNWDFSNSILNKNVKAEDIRNINDLHHLVKDPYYANATVSDRPSRKEVYGFIMDTKDWMGVKNEWVKNTHGYTSATDAEIDIRENWNPATPNSGLYGMNRYKDLRFRWNFTAAMNYDGTNNSDCEKYFSKRTLKNKIYTEKYASAFLQRNAGSLKSWLTVSDDNDKPAKDVTTYKYKTPLADLEAEGDLANLRFSQSNNTELDKSTRYDKDGYTGVYLPYGTVSASNGGTNEDLQNVFKFKVASSGTLYLRVHNPGTEKSRLTVAFKKLNTNTNGFTKIKTLDTAAGKTEEYSVDVNITGNNGDLFIFSDEVDKKKNPNVVFEIEYIRSPYVYETDRKGIMPSKEQPIPMYGVQNFSKLTNWEEGTTFDLSNAASVLSTSDYKKKDIYLIRALAKIELYLPNKAEHVFMRSMNRYARCEPVDVETPTDQTWKYSDNDINHNYAEGTPDGNKCEWFTIKNYGVGFAGRWTTGDDGKEKEEEVKNKDQLPNYQSYLSWFYGSWQSAKWQNGGTQGWSFTGVTVPTEDSKGKYPHVFYPDINRSGFAEFNYEGETPDGGHKYVLYMPDKNIDDPNYPGVTSSIPKIAHIEYRYEEEQENLDDDNCYRIYFADVQPQFKKDRTTPFGAEEFESDFEKRIDSLNDYYGLRPVMRNHIYSFYVTDDGPAVSPTTMEVRVRVTDWGYKKIENNLW